MVADDVGRRTRLTSVLTLLAAIQMLTSAMAAHDTQRWRTAGDSSPPPKKVPCDRIASAQMFFDPCFRNWLNILCMSIEFFVYF